MARVIDLSTLPGGRRYEDQYGEWLKVFQTVAESEEEIRVISPPASWVSLLYYLGASLMGHRVEFPQDNFLDDPYSAIHSAENRGHLRELVEIHSACRPELVDALYKSDMEWSTKNRRHLLKKEFVVTCNGSFFRPEVLDYLNNVLPTYQPTKPKCVIVPCAADKPYPAELHNGIRASIPDDYEIIIATGVLGLVPEALWPQMPLYDAGLPNQWRMMEVCADFFTKNFYKRVVVYSDFNNVALHRGLVEANTRRKRRGDWEQEFEFVNEIKHYTSYLNLLSPDLLQALSAMAR